MTLAPKLAPASSGTLGRQHALEAIEHGLTEHPIHGRGGQGAVMASNVLAKALHEDGIWLQPFPYQGVERRGAPAAAHARPSEAKSLIPVPTEITRPHHIIVFDPTLVRQMNLTEGQLPGDLLLTHSTAACANGGSRCEPKI